MPRRTEHTPGFTMRARVTRSHSPTPLLTRHSVTLETKKRVVQRLFNYSSRSLGNCDELSQNESFDVLPKTDYTYARTGSYSPRLLRKTYVSPNMSRRRLHGEVTPPISMLEDSDSDLEVDGTTVTDKEAVDQVRTTEISVNDSLNHYFLVQTEQHNEDSDIGSDDMDSNEVSYNSYLNGKHQSDKKNKLLHLSKESRGLDSRGFDGMILRSGNHLRGVKNFLAGNRRNSTSTLSSTTVNTLITSKETRTSCSAANVLEKQQMDNGFLAYRNASKTVLEVDNQETNINNSAGFKKRNARSTAEKRRLRNSSSSREDLLERNEHKRVSDEYESEKRGHRIRHMYGLDSDNELSDSDLYSQRPSEMHSHNTSRNTARDWRTFFGLEALMYLLSSFPPARMGHAMATGILGRVGMPAFRFGTFGSRWMMRKITAVASYFLLLDSWLLSRRLRKGWCLIIPLLLFLPLFFMGTQYSSHLMSSKPSFMSTFLGESETQPFSKLQWYQASYIRDPLTLHDEVHKIVLQLLSQNRQWLTREEVESLVHSKLRPEMESVRISLLNIVNEVNMEQDNLKVEQQDNKARLLAIEQQLAVLLGKTKSLENDWTKARSSFEKNFATEREKQKKVLVGMQTSLEDVQTQTEELQKKYVGILNHQHKCCINDSMFTNSIRAEVNSMITEMLGKKEGDGSFSGWLNQRYVNRKEFDRQLRLLTADITERLSSSMENHRTNIVMPPGSKTLSEDAVKLIVEDALLKYSSDRTGLPDYALESGGGSVISTRCSETYYKKTALVSIFGIPLWYTSNSPRTVIQPDVHAGQCWAFKGESGYLVIQLAVPIRPTAFSLEHIPKSLSTTGKIDSAPRDFEVYGLESETATKGINLGNFSYSTVGKPIQHFEVQIQNPGVFRFIELRILNNHGNKEYTCVYRFRVHGVPQ
ncbi:sun domain-containing protein 1-like isoform X2 [Pomacea canaliculata]|uniref:sun domain-containing protein 1-like isoform X2 n=1 Tax=Pomacea canaliculata TaxID=400727 RepID=UPI000D73F1F6|nr:sun domain-containing protein 1-like isoform X2 [Pomacea canaliculata]